jgi:hypothetical protein
MPEIAKSVVVFRPTQLFLDWLNGFSEGRELLELAMVREDSSGYLIPECDDRDQALEFIRPHATRFFQHLLYGWCTNEELWPAEMGFETLCEWFDIELVSTLFETSAWIPASR